jgi:hypothetical protein
MEGCGKQVPGHPAIQEEPQKTRPSAQYHANDLAQPGYRNWLAPSGEGDLWPGLTRADVIHFTDRA